jgi:hypothetical protein
MATLNLFPARIPFVNADGTLTTEAFRALQIVFSRVGGALGDSGTDVFGQVFGVANETGNLSALQTDIVQPVNFGSDYYNEVVQYQASSKGFTDATYPDVTQPINNPDGGFSSLSVSGNATIGGTLKLAVGTVGLPSLYWSTDTTTGFYRISANNNGYAVSGVKLLDLLSTGLGIAGALNVTGVLTAGNVDNAFSISAVGATGDLQLTGYNTAVLGASIEARRGAVYKTLTLGGTSVTIGTTGAGALVVSAAGATVTGAFTTPGGATFHTTNTALANGAAAAAGTLLNAPVAGNPTKWIGINDNGTTRYIPAW